MILITEANDLHHRVTWQECFPLFQNFCWIFQSLWRSSKLYFL